MVHVLVLGAVDGSFCGELQGVKEVEALHTEGAAQLQQGVADPTWPVVHQLDEGDERSKEFKETLKGQVDHFCANFQIEPISHKYFILSSALLNLSQVYQLSLIINHIGVPSLLPWPADPF